MANLIVEKGAVPKVTAKKITTYEYNEIYDIRETDYVYNDSTEMDWGLVRQRPINWEDGNPWRYLSGDAAGWLYKSSTDTREKYIWTNIMGTYTDPLGDEHQTIVGVKLVSLSDPSATGILSQDTSQSGAIPPAEWEGHTRIATIYTGASVRAISSDEFSITVHDDFSTVGDAIDHIRYEWTPVAVMEDYHYDEQGTIVIDGITTEAYIGKGVNTSSPPPYLPTIYNEVYQPEIQSHTITVSEVVT